MAIPPDTGYKGYIPPRSPSPLLQELYVGTPHWPWKILVLCMMLNQTSREQVEPVAKKFFDMCSSPLETVLTDEEEIKRVLRPLGFYNKRAAALKRMSLEYFSEGWEDVREIYGIGKYARDAWRIFVLGDHDNVEPDDHALNDYHAWITRSDSEKRARESKEIAEKAGFPSTIDLWKTFNWMETNEKYEKLGFDFIAPYRDKIAEVHEVFKDVEDFDPLSATPGDSFIYFTPVKMRLCRAQLIFTFPDGHCTYRDLDYVPRDEWDNEDVFYAPGLQSRRRWQFMMKKDTAHVEEK